MRGPALTSNVIAFCSVLVAKINYFYRYSSGNMEVNDVSPSFYYSLLLLFYALWYLLDTNQKALLL